MATRQVVPVSSPRAAMPFSPVDNEPPPRCQRALHLAPGGDIAVARRAIEFALLAWLPIAIWAIMRGRVAGAAIGEPLFEHYGVHVRCLVVLPLLILGEATLDRAARRYFPQFVRSGIVDDETQPAFEATLRSVARIRDSSLPWLFVISLAIGWTIADRGALRTDAMAWALDENGVLGFGGVWFAFVVRPLFLALVLGWLWRIVLLAILFVRVGRLQLSLVPSHPDRAGGLGFLEQLPGAFAPVTLALSAMLASRWAHQVVYHGETVDALELSTVTFVVGWSLLLHVPFLALMPALWTAKRAALPGYAAMVAEQGRDVRRRWIDGTARVDTPLVEPSGVGPIADAATMYDAVRSMRVFIVGKSSLVGILLPIAVPMLILVALQIPVRDLLLGLLKALM